MRYFVRIVNNGISAPLSDSAGFTSKSKAIAYGRKIKQRIGKGRVIVTDELQKRVIWE